MTNKRITDLVEATALDNADLATVVDVSETDPALKNKKINTENLKTTINYISSTDATALISGGDNALHRHPYDRDLANSNGSLTEPVFTTSSTTETGTKKVETTNNQIAFTDTATSLVAQLSAVVPNLFNINVDSAGAGTNSALKINVGGTDVAEFAKQSESPKLVINFPYLTLGDLSGNYIYIIIGTGNPADLGTPVGSIPVGSLFFRTDSTTSSEPALYKRHFTAPSVDAWVAI